MSVVSSLVCMCCVQGINAILFFAPIIFKSLGNGQSMSLLGAVAVRPPVPIPPLLLAG